MTKFFLVVLTLVFSFICSIWVMMFGWGVDVKSWGIIITGFFVNTVLLGMLELVKGEK